MNSKTSISNRKRPATLPLQVLFTLCGLILSSTFVFAQTFPPPTSCTSKDLRLVSASLAGATPCFTCTPGTTVTRGLNLAINNKTGSTRTAFAYWGTLEIYNANGTLASSSPISGCVGPVPKNATTTFSNGSLTYVCGQSLKLVNLYLAWTDASPSSTCNVLTSNTATINPKCGTLPELMINAGVDGIITTASATCTSNGSITVAPFGSVGPYSVRIGATVFNNVTTSVTFNNLPEGTYSVIVTDANNCSATRTTTIGPPTNQPPAPVSGGDQTQCELSPVQTLTATATTVSGATVAWYDAASGGNLVANPTRNSVGSTTYYAQANLGTCTSATRTPVILTIEPTPANPVSGGNQTECEQSPIQTLTATATGSNIAWFSASSGGSSIANPTLNNVGSLTYFAEASIGVCKSASRTPVSLTINPTPANPVSGGNQTQCEQSPVQTLTASATGSNIAWFSTVSGGSPVATPSLSSVGTLTYYAEASLGACKSFGRTSVTLTIEPTPANPVSGGNQSECEQSPLQTLTATATGSNIAWFSTVSGGSPVVNPTLSNVGTITYYAEASIGVCKSASRTAVSLTINPTPSNPVSGGNQTQCAQAPVQTLTATATGSNIAWFSAASGGSPVASPTLNSVGTVTYYAEASIGTCKSFGRTAVTLTINPNPAAPQICIVEPSLCGPATGSITFLSPTGAGTLYSINNGVSYQSSPFFLNLAAGSVNGIMVKDVNGCESPAVVCNASNCGSTPPPVPEDANAQDQPLDQSNNRTLNNSPKEIALNVFPNPFTDKVRFVADVPQEGSAILEVYDMLGKKVSTVYTGKVVAGVTTFEMNMPYQQYANYIYRFVVDGKQVTGKLIQSKP